ncbi:NAD(P)H-hydrate dehydratase [Nitrosomonas sp. Nm132]|uniref:NAD(P)H-hydrate dehydratase n=1 Tax=Nitrosomonas sp. Nm132 TaxID=1881053 RepID=UPI00088A12FC|nr:NAD(P)H-hydrate dehydratase [Nitrosomonas sp. Nm132]SDG98353.1 yjeF C-terminal region, hydroxyethylthiazole kinase-related/yjeF N-terminal region [Nitrosomonas sp. Nm132]
MNNPTPVYSTPEIREIEQLAAALPNSPSLMEKAGLAAAYIVKDRLLINDKNKVLVLAGPGNNGGDAFVAARHLHAWGFQVTTVFTGASSHLSQDAGRALENWLRAGGKLHSEIPSSGLWHVVIDGLFGIGLNPAKHPLGEKYQHLIKAVNNMNLPVLALDIPSGLSADSGVAPNAAVKATITVTFIGLKPGLLTHEGCEYSGEIILCNLDLDAISMPPPRSWLLDETMIKRLLPAPRPINSHKGVFGSVGIIGGSSGMVGAALLAGSAALKLGAGRVYLGLIVDQPISIDPTQPELMLRSVDDLFELNHLNCLIVGPGLGKEIAACLYLEKALHTSLPLVLDADALNLIACYPELASTLRMRKAPSILTPHAAETARLLNTDIATVQSHRMQAAENLVKDFNCSLVLKGAGSICMLPNGHCYFNTSGNPGLSSAGTGDVLSGMIGALLAQGVSSENALLLAVYLHGAAADNLLETLHGPIGMTASEIIHSARHLLNQWIYGHDAQLRYSHTHSIY